MLRAFTALIMLLVVCESIQAKDFVRPHDSRASFLIAHETLVSRLEYNKLRLEMSKEGSIKKRRILCFQIPVNMKDLYEVNILNRKWQTDEELKKSQTHLQVLSKKRNEILLSGYCQGS